MSTLGEFLARIQQVETIPCPAAEEWADLINRISVPGRILEVNDDSSSHCTSCHAFSDCKGPRLPVFDSIRRRR